MEVFLCFRFILEVDVCGEWGYDVCVKWWESGGSVLRAVGRRFEEGVGVVFEVGVEDFGELGGGVYGVGGVGGCCWCVGCCCVGVVLCERVVVVDVGGVARGDVYGIDWDWGFFWLVFCVGLCELSC